MQVRLDDFRILTDQNLQYCLVNDWLEIVAQALNMIPGHASDVKF